MRIKYIAKLILFVGIMVIIFRINVQAFSIEKNKLFPLINHNREHSIQLGSEFRNNNNNFNSKIFIAEGVSSEKKTPTETVDKKSKQSDENTNPSESRKPQKEKSILKANPIQFCQGKYKKMSGIGFEFITVKCPSVEDICTCDLDIKGFREWVDCGGKRKPSSKGSDFVDCKSVIVVN